MANVAPKMDLGSKVMFLLSAVAILLTVYVLISSLFSTYQRNATKGEVDSTQLVMSAAENLMPIGVTAIAGAAPPKAAKSLSGKEVFASTCTACHSTGAAGAPKLEKAAWEPRVATGLSALMNSALNGKGAMPARGGNPALTDTEIKATILYMVKEAGFDLGSAEPAPAAKKETAKAPEKKVEATAIQTEETKKVEAPTKPAVPTAPVAASSPSAPVVTATPEAPKMAAVKSTAEGKKVYGTVCFACHATGVAGSPKLGDKAAWTPRIATGMDSLYNTALHGKGAMPPKGGNMSLADDKVKAAVDYMVEQAK